MEPTSPAQYEASKAGRMPASEPISDGVWSVPVLMPGDFLAYSLSVVAISRAGAITVIDPGWGGAGALLRYTKVLNDLGRSVTDIKTIVVTHGHPDHIGLAEALRAASGAKLCMHTNEHAALQRAAVERRDEFDPAVLRERLARWGLSGREAALPLAAIASAEPADQLEPTSCDLLLTGGDQIDAADGKWRVLETPGHTAGHICLVDEDRQLLFSGDHVLPTVHPGIGIGSPSGGEPIADYLRSLDRVAPFDDFEVIPGHGYRFRGLAARRLATREHVLRRAREVGDVLDLLPHATVYEIASHLTWSAGWEQLSSSVMLYTALSQVEMYRAFVAGTVNRR
jgi:glyoxylase-like metal-dependent hydrolase (beta-lactamase superfamily II)